MNVCMFVCGGGGVSLSCEFCELAEIQVSGTTVKLLDDTLSHAFLKYTVNDYSMVSFTAGSRTIVSKLRLSLRSLRA